jgi:hypothetical protein
LLFSGQNLTVPTKANSPTGLQEIKTNKKVSAL